MKLNQLFTRFIARLSQRRRTSETLVLVLLSVFVGLSSGAGVWFFKRMIDFFSILSYDMLGSALKAISPWLIVLIPVAGGALVGLIVQHLIGPERHHGVSGIMESVALAGGRLRYDRVPAKAIASALSIGVGASVGPEDPSVQIGANFGSMLGQMLHLSDDRIRALVAAGSAGGIAAAFNAPIAGVFFALEIVLGELSGSALSIVVLSAVISAIFTQAVSGREPAFHVPSYPYGSVWELPLYLVLGLLAGVIAALYIRTLYAARDAFHELALPTWAKPAIAGAIVGVAGLFLPQGLGVGYQTIGSIFAGEKIGWMLLLGLLVAKLILTPISIGGGFQGGVFAPSLYLGAALGGAFGIGCNALFPNLGTPPAAFAMVGMAAVLAGAVHAPLTAFLLLFEMTNDYRIILPLMFAVVISLLISERLQPESIYTLSLLRKGIRLDRGRDVEVLEGLTVGEVMSHDFAYLKASEPLAEALAVFEKTHSHGFPVLNEKGELAGMFTITDLEKVQANGVDLSAHTVGEYCTREVVVAHPDETLSAALRRMSVNQIGRVPVVESGDPLHTIGLLRRADIIRAYDTALSRRITRIHRAQEVRLSTFSRMPVEEARVEINSVLAGRTVSEIPWPRDMVVASVRRGSEILIPHGNTRLEPGDTVVFVSESGKSTDEVRRMCRQKKDAPMV